MARLEEKDVELVLSTGKKIIVDLLVYGDWYDYERSEVSEYEVENASIWVNNDWEGLDEDKDLTPEERDEYNNKLWEYADSCSDDFPYSERAIYQSKKEAEYFANKSA